VFFFSRISGSSLLGWDSDVGKTNSNLEAEVSSFKFLVQGSDSCFFKPQVTLQVCGTKKVFVVRK
jgi:hypothetical protein